MKRFFASCLLTLGLLFWLGVLVGSFNPTAAEETAPVVMLLPEHIKKKELDTFQQNVRSLLSRVQFQNLAELSTVDPNAVYLVPVAKRFKDTERTGIQTLFKSPAKVMVFPLNQTNSMEYALKSLIEQRGIKVGYPTGLETGAVAQWQVNQLPMVSLAPKATLLPVPVNDDLFQAGTWKTDNQKSYSAIVSTDKTVILSWPWAQNVLNPNHDQQLILYVLEQMPAEVSQYLKAQAIRKQAAQKQASGLDAITASILGQTLPEQAPGEDGTVQDRPSINYGLYYQRMRYLDDFKAILKDAMAESHELMFTDLPTQQIQEAMDEATDAQGKFSSESLLGNEVAAVPFFETARAALTKAVLALKSPMTVEGRSIWLDRGTIVKAGGPEGMKKLMQSFYNNGINMVFVESINAGYAAYDSDLMVKNPLIQGWDPLKVAVEEGHRLGMEVHAWVWCFAVGNTRHNPLIGKPHDYAGPVLVDKGLMSEALRGISGNLTLNNQHEFWLSPASPKARKFLVDAYSEIIRKYDVDGLQLDYIRYPFQKWNDPMGFEAIGAQRFLEDTGVSLSAGALGGDTRAFWEDWKAKQVTLFVKEVAEAIRAIRPSVQLSGAVFPMARPRRIQMIQQDWETWAANGWIDTLQPMIYTASADRLNWMTGRVEHGAGKKVLVYPGMRIDNIDPIDLLLELTMLEHENHAGWTLFAAAHLNEERIPMLRSYKDTHPLEPSVPMHQRFGALFQLMKTFRVRYDVLNKGKALSLALSPRQIESLNGAVDRAFAHVVRATEEAKLLPAWTPANQEELRLKEAAIAKQLEDNLQPFLVEARVWLNIENMFHRMRYRYFNGLLTRMETVLAYTQTRRSPKPPEPEPVVAPPAVSTDPANPGGFPAVIPQPAQPASPPPGMEDD